MSKKFDDDVILENCDVIVIFPIYGQFAAIRKPDSGPTVSKLIFSLIITFYLSKTENRAKKSLIALAILLWVKVLFWPKNADFLQKNADISKIKKVLVIEGIFSETTDVCVLTCQIWSF